MMRVLLLLGACFCVGFSYDVEDYGRTFRWRLQRRAHSIEFTQKHSTDATVLWERADPVATEDSRGKVTGNYFVISDLTQEDSGRYIMRDSDRLPLLVKTIDVVAISESYTRSTGESLRVAFDLEPSSCNIFFTPEGVFSRREAAIVLKGRLQMHLYESDCEGFVLLKPCGVLNEDLQIPCFGQYEVRDSKGNTALKVSLDLYEPQFDISEVGTGIGVSLAIMSCCTCVWHCCCGKSSKKDTSETPEDEPAVQYREASREPAGPRPERLRPPSDTFHPPPSSYTPTGPLIHNPPTSVPPSYFEIHNPPTSVPPSYSEFVDADAVAVPVDSEPGPRFELKGMDFPSMLGSGSAISDVYSSDKLNIL